MKHLIPANTSNPLLLIVDDSAENLQVLHALLKDYYRIKVAKNGAKAIEIAHELEKPDLILLDIMMPEMDGYAVCEALRKDSVTRQIPIIFLTALNEVQDETKGFQVGGSDFIVKPFNPDIVKARIKTHIDLQFERRRSDDLLRVLLPDKVIDDLKQFNEHKPEIKQDVSILFCDFVGFTKITSQLDPEFLIGELSEIFGAFDEICTKNGCARIKTIGDAYMAASGLFERTPHHAQGLVQTGKEFIDLLNERNKTSQQAWHCRIGIHSGEVIAGIIGKTRFIYDVMGDDVNIAARVESAGQTMKVTFTQATKDKLGEHANTVALGKVNLKGKGEMDLFMLD